MQKSSKLRVITHVPLNALAIVQQAVWDAGAGQKGAYKNCAFVIPGTGYFTPRSGAKPAIGEVGKPEQVEEYHFEFLCERKILETVISEL